MFHYRYNTGYSKKRPHNMHLLQIQSHGICAKGCGEMTIFKGGDVDVMEGHDSYAADLYPKTMGGCTNFLLVNCPKYVGTQPTEDDIFCHKSVAVLALDLGFYFQ
jgi:hypothetical protein